MDMYDARGYRLRFADCERRPSLASTFPCGVAVSAHGRGVYAKSEDELFLLNPRRGQLAVESVIVQFRLQGADAVYKWLKSKN